MMARKTADVDQMQLIDVDSPETKAVKRHAIGYMRMREANSGERERMREKEADKADKLRASLKECGIKPGPDGVTQCQIGGMHITIPAMRNPAVRVKMVDDDGYEVDDSGDDE